MSYNRTGKLCEAPGCTRKSRSGSAAYCDTHYLRLRRGQQNPLKPLVPGHCGECGIPLVAIGVVYCSHLCGQRHRRNTPEAKQRGRAAPIAMVESDVRRWLPVPGFPDYEISNDGRLRRATAGSNSKPGRSIRATFHQTGYPQYGLNPTAGKRRYMMAHRIVALAFLPPAPPDKPNVLHRNDNKLDARDSNLRWGTPQENSDDALRNGRLATGDRHSSAAQPWTRPRGDGHAFAIPTDDQVRIILSSPESSKTLGRRYDVSPDAIQAIRRGKTWRHLTDPAYAASLIEGARNFASPKPKRKTFSSQQRFELLKRENYRCHLCEGLIYPGQGWDISHEVPLELGGADDDTNRRAAHRKCHRVRTATVDIPAIAKAKRVQAKHHAGATSRRPMRGGRDDDLKRKMDGTVVVRSTGEPWTSNTSQRGK